MKIYEKNLFKNIFQNTSTMNPVIINNVEYYLTTDLMTTDKEYFKGCQGKPRTILEKRNKKNIQEKDYIYAYQKDNKWIVSKKEYNKAYLLLTKSFCEANLPSMKKDIPTPPPVEDKTPTADVVPKKTEQKPLPAPPVLQLTDSEKFKDEQGNPLDIEVRGERAHDKIFFRAKDIADTFEMKHLLKNISDTKSSFKYEEDYIKFIVIRKSEDDKTTQKYFTYDGVLKVLYSSHSQKAKVFRKWATEVLFTHQMGTTEQRNVLAANLLGLPYDEMKKYLNIQSGVTYCIYLSIIGKVSDLRKSMKLSDEFEDGKYVCKFGKTENLEQRIKGHRNEYKEIKGANWMLRKIAMIEPLYISKAETDLKHFCEAYKLKYMNKEELIVVSLADIEKIEDKMCNLRYLYGTQQQELAGTIDDYNRRFEKREHEHKIEVMNLQHIIQIKDKDNEILHRDLENRDLKLEVLRLKYENK